MGYIFMKLGGFLSLTQCTQFAKLGVFWEILPKKHPIGPKLGVFLQKMVYWRVQKLCFFRYREWWIFRVRQAHPRTKFGRDPPPPWADILIIMIVHVLHFLSMIMYNTIPPTKLCRLNMCVKRFVTILFVWKGLPIHYLNINFDTTFTTSSQDTHFVNIFNKLIIFSYNSWEMWLLKKCKVYFEPLCTQCSLISKFSVYSNDSLLRCVGGKKKSLTFLEIQWVMILWITKWVFKETESQLQVCCLCFSEWLRDLQLFIISTDVITNMQLILYACCCWLKVKLIQGLLSMFNECSYIRLKGCFWLDSGWS